MKKILSVIVFFLLGSALGAVETGILSDTVSIGLEGWTKETDQFSWGGLFVKLLLAMTIVLFLIWAVTKYLKKGGKLFFQTKGPIQQLYTMPLGTNRYLMVVEFGGKILLLGVTENEINCLTEIVEKDKIEEVKLKINTRENKKNFQEILKEEVDAEAEPRRLRDELKERLGRRD